MKSKFTFSQAEANEIISLIEQKLKADPTKQKAIRAKIRRRGFWASDFGLRDGYTVDDFLSAANISGIIKNTKTEEPTMNIITPPLP